MSLRKPRLQRNDGSMKCGWPKGEWPMCIVCDGRIHLPTCTAKMNKNKDCCPARHKMLHDQGQIKGIFDASFFMWSEEYPQGYHPNDIQPKGNQ